MPPRPSTPRIQRSLIWTLLWPSSKTRKPSSNRRTENSTTSVWRTTKSSTTWTRRRIICPSLIMKNQFKSMKSIASNAESRRKTRSWSEPIRNSTMILSAKRTRKLRLWMKNKPLSTQSRLLLVRSNICESSPMKTEETLSPSRWKRRSFHRTWTSSTRK